MNLQFREEAKIRMRAMMHQVTSKFYFTNLNLLKVKQFILLKNNSDSSDKGFIILT